VGNDGLPQAPLASVDGGKSFAPVRAALGVVVLAVDDRGVSWGADGGRLLTSKDGGATWVFAGSPGLDEGPTRLVIGPPGLWAFGKLGGYVSSHDGGKHWKTPTWSGGFLGSELISDGATLWVPGDTNCSVHASTDGRTFKPVFQHALDDQHARDYHAMTCPPEHLLSALTVDGTGSPWFVVGREVWRGTRLIAPLPTVGDAPMSLAITPRSVCYVDLPGTLRCRDRNAP
jgi:hypothetical protein